MRAILILLCALSGAVGAYFAQPLAHGNQDAVTVMITATTVFGGFLVAIIAVIGDPALIPDGSWKVAEMRRDGIEHKLIAHSWLFVLYLVTIGLLFIAVLLKEAGPELAKWCTWIERAYLFFGITSFLLTFGLPGALLRLQLARIEAVIEQRRQRAGLPD